MKKIKKSILIALCVLFGFSASAALGVIASQNDTVTVSAESTYATKDVAMLGRVAGWYGNGNFEIRLTLGECDWANESGQKSFDTTNGDLPTLLRELDFFNRIKLGEKTLAEWGCNSCYDNIYWLNSGEPKYTLMIPLSMNAEGAVAAAEAGIGANYPVTILEGALIPSYAYLQGDKTATVYRAGCDYVTQNGDVDYGIMAYGKTEVESVQYVTGWDSNYSNAYFGVSLKGDDFDGNGTQMEANSNNYQSSIFTAERYANKIVVDDENGKAEVYGLFNLGDKGKGYFSFVFRAKEEETESITIPAGTLFPSYAMTNLREVNGNSVYIMYQTKTDVTFVKNSEGKFVVKSENVNNYIENAKAELDGYKAEAGYFKETEAAQRLAIVEEAKAKITDNMTEEEVNAIVAEAKNAIDALTPASEYYTTKDVAMAGRIAGWYGNGNFTLAVTLGYADWTNEQAGTKTYDGDLTKLLTKLGFFNSIVVGGKTLAEWGCTACYDNGYELNASEPDNIFLFHLAMGKENMDVATAAGIGGSTPITILEGAIIPSYGYLTHTSDEVYYAGCDYKTINSSKAYGIESVAKTTVESVKYVQGHDGTCGYFGISFVGDDYLGNGTQLEINTNYDFEEKFVDKVLVNGEAGKVGYYGLFNLGSNGVGYYAFKMDVPEKEIVSITIPAGTRFPTRAMTELREINNNNPVYIMYEVEETVILYRTEEGYVSYVDFAISQIENYKEGLFREAEENQRVEIIANAIATIRSATDNVTIDTAVTQAKAAIDQLKTAGQYADEENAALLEAKNNAIAELENYKADVEYFEEQTAQRVAIINQAKESLNGVYEVSGIATIVEATKAKLDEVELKSTIVASAKTELDGYKAEEGYFKENEANQRLDIIDHAKEAIDNATTQAQVNSAVQVAKTAIDNLVTAAEYYTTKDVAMAGRIAGWYGNGNFTLAVTLGYADWTNEQAGTKTYDGDLTKLLTKLGFFNSIVVGGKTLAEWGCTACYDNGYELNASEPDNIFLFHLAMGQENMDVATAAGIGGSTPITILEGAIIPSYGYLTHTSDEVYYAGCDYETINSSKAYGIESVAKTTVESVKYVQAFNAEEGNCGYFGISLVGDDYLGNGSQIVINQNYYFDNKFIDMILVNGETGKVGYYGLFNLGTQGEGYYAFQINVPEEEIVSITIPAGTRFPSRAMTDLYDINANPVYIMYEIENEITIYKLANGYGTYAEYKAEELNGYKAGLFREAEETERLDIVAQAKASMNGLSVSEIDEIVAQAKASIDELKTAAQYADEELADDKQSAVSEIEGYMAGVEYLEEQAEERATAIENGKNRVALATTVEEIAEIVSETKATIDELESKSEIISTAVAEVENYKADVEYLAEQEAQKATIIAEAKTAIENSTTKALIEETVSTAKNSIDELQTKEEIEANILSAKQEEANAKVDDIKKAIDFDLYSEEEIATINSLYSTVKTAIENATNEDEINTAVAEFESALAEITDKDNNGESSTTSSESNGGGCSGMVGGIPCSILLLLVAGKVVYKKKEN